MKKIHVPFNDKSYDVIIGKGLIKDIDKFLDTTNKYIIITDTNIPAIYIDDLQSKLSILKVYKVPPGESSKSMKMASQLLNQLVDDNITRDTIIISLGGGVIGDLAGFIASTYMRGISFVQIPTSLLAQVDSSVGGKVGVNANNMKNAIGAFHQPIKVIIDPITLETLEERHFNNGVAEIIKHGLIAGKSLYKDLLELDIKENIEDIIYQSITIKKDIVIQDEKDYGVRNLLNFAHTIGHAIEQDSQYKLLHGESIAISMLKLSKGHNYEDSLKKILKKYNLLIDYDYNKNTLYNYIQTDKKIQKDTLNFVIVEEVGKGFIKAMKVNRILEYM